MVKVEETIGSVHGVLAVHDLHVWTVGSGMICCSCHIMVDEQSVRSGENVLRAVTQQLEHNFGITHTTIQVEVKAVIQMTCTALRRQPSILRCGAFTSDIAPPLRVGVLECREIT